MGLTLEYSLCCGMARRLLTSLVGHTSVLLNAATCWFLAPELSSADEVFQLLHRPSGTLPAHLRSTLISRRQFRDGLNSHLFTDDDDDDDDDDAQIYKARPK